MNADLVRAAGLELGLEQRLRGLGVRPHLHAPDDRARKPTGGIDPDAPLAVARDVARERELDRRSASRHLPRTRTS